MASDVLKDTILELIAGKALGVSHKTMYSIDESPVDIAKAINELTQDGLLVRLGSGKNATYFDSKAYNTSEVTTNKVDSHELIAAASTDKYTAASVRRWPILQKGSAKAQVVWVLLELGCGANITHIFSKLQDKWQEASTKPTISRTTLSIYCHTLMKEGFIERTSRGVYRYCGPEDPFDSSSLAMFGSKVQGKILFRNAPAQQRREDDLVNQVEVIAESLALLQTKVAKILHELKNKT